MSTPEKAGQDQQSGPDDDFRRRFVIVGPGALGSVFAAFLLRAGHSVQLLGRVSSPSPEHLRVSLQDGTVVDLGHVVTSDPSVVEAADVIILLVKVGDTGEALAAIRPFVRSGQQILTLQNGLGGAQRLIDTLGVGPQILAGVTSQAAYRPSPHSVIHTGAGPTIIGPLNPEDMSAASVLARELHEAGLPTAAVSDIERWVWQKVAVNAAINGITALAGTSNGVIVDEPGLLDTAELIGEEVGAVARARGIELGNLRQQIAETASATAANRSSMLQDMDAGRKTEVDAIHGAIVQAGEAVGIATPANQVLASLIRLRERPGT